MVGGDFQKSLQLLVSYGYCVFEDDVCVNPAGILGGSKYQNIGKH